MNGGTLSGRVLAGTVTAVAVALALAGAALYSLMERSLVGEIDRGLLDKARLLASTVEQEGRYVDVELEDLDMSGLGKPEQGGFAQLWDADGRTLYRSPSLRGATLERPEPRGPDDAPRARWAELPGGLHGRLVTLSFHPRQERRGATPALLTLALGRDTRDVDQALASLQRLLLLVGLLTLAAAAAALLAVVRRSLRPLTAVSERIGAIGEDELATRLPLEGVPGELRPIVERVNGLLARLEAAFTRERAFSSEVAHELRTPLAGLRTTLEVSGARPRSAEEYRAALERGAALSDQLQRLVERLLQLARLDAEQVQVAPTPLDLSDQVLEAWEPLAAAAQERRLEVTWALEEGLQVDADRELLRLVLRNLLENAVRYADAGGQVELTSAQGTDGVRLRVENTGSQLGPEEVHQATQRFWRGDTARSEAGLHCGLGLALVERASRALGGALELSSQRGGTFAATLRLPGRLAVPAALAGAGV